MARAGEATAAVRRARALIVGRWVGVPIFCLLLVLDDMHEPSRFIVAALAVAAAVMAANLVQVRLVAAAREAAVRRMSWLLLGLDAAMVTFGVTALSRQPDSGFWALFGWIPVEGTLAGGPLLAVAGGAASVVLALLSEAAGHHAPSLVPPNPMLVRALDLAAVGGVMVVLGRALDRNEQEMARSTSEAAALAAAEQTARVELQAFSTIVLAGVAERGDLGEVLQAMTAAVASTLSYERMAVFVAEGEVVRCRAWYGDWEGAPSLAFPIGPGSVVGKVTGTGQAELVADPSEHPDYYPGVVGTHAEICAPLRLAGRVLGAVNVESLRRRAFTQDDLERLQRLADQMAIVVSNAHLADETRALAASERDARREIEAVSRAVMTGVDLAHVAEDLDRVLAGIAEALGYAKLAFVAEEAPGKLRIRGAFGYPAKVVRSGTACCVAGITRRVFDTGEPYRSAGPALDEGRPGTASASASPSASPSASALAVPVRVGDRTLGVLITEADRPDAFDSGDSARLARIAGQVAVVLERARLAAGEALTAARLQELDRLKEDFIAMTSHELRTPLTVIRGFTRTLLRDDHGLNAVQHRHFIQVIDRQAARLTRLVEDLLLISRIETYGLDVALSEQDPGKLLAEYAEEWSSEPARVLLDVAPGLPPVRTDPDRLAQVVRNLVDNALRYGGGTPVRVVAAADGDELVVEVRDRGPGIAAAELPQVFERFRQVGSSSQHRVGMGLGLYITHQLVQALGGRIEAESTLGHGSTFRVRLPARAGAPAPSPLTGRATEA